MILADNGSPWYLSGVPNEGWDNNRLRELRDIHGSDFEAVWVKAHMVEWDSGQTQTPHFVFLPGARR